MLPNKTYILFFMSCIGLAMVCRIGTKLSIGLNFYFNISAKCQLQQQQFSMFYGLLCVFQVEYYFSDINLATTEHLMRFISKDPEGYGKCFTLLLFVFKLEFLGVWQSFCGFSYYEIFMSF
jgi:hypothetical protein